MRPRPWTCRRLLLSAQQAAAPCHALRAGPPPTPTPTPQPPPPHLHRRQPKRLDLQGPRVPALEQGLRQGGQGRAGAQLVRLAQRRRQAHLLSVQAWSAAQGSCKRCRGAHLQQAILVGVCRPLYVHHKRLHHHAAAPAWGGPTGRGQARWSRRRRPSGSQRQNGAGGGGGG